MLPAQARLRRRPDFTAVVRSGRRAGRPTLVVHVLVHRTDPAVCSRAPQPAIGARAGFVVGKSVGNAVVRHRVTRRLRAVVNAEFHRLPPSADLVVRARPESAAVSSAELRADLVAGLDRVLSVRAPRLASS